jgi:uncharacterized protein
MNNRLSNSGGGNWLVWSTLYAVVVYVFAGYVNYTQPYSSDPVSRPALWELILWGSLYIPIIILPIVAGLKVTDFGFTLNPFLALAVCLLIPICAFMNPAAIVTWQNSLIEAFARTGEEVFFRGFLIVLFSELFQNKRRPWLWAVITSSILFALVHTQMFQPGYLARYGSASMPVGYQIVERSLNLFGVALVFALMRVWLRSILPGAIAHSLSIGGIAALPFVVLIYGAATIWAHWRGETVLLRGDGLRLA